MDGLPIRGIMWIVICIAVNAIAEAMVTAFESVSEPGMEKRAEEGDENAKRILELKERHRRYITVTDYIRILSFAGITVSYTQSVFPKLYLQFKIMTGHTIPAGVLSAAVTVLAVMATEVLSIKLPKKLAFKNADAFSEHTVGMLRFLMKLFAPFAWCAEKITAGILAVFHISNSEQEETVTEEELIFNVTEAQENGVIEAEEAEMIHNIFAFDAKEVKDIMTHRKNMIAVDAQMSLEEAMKFMMDAAYSRFPVYEDTVENIIGILHMKDVMRLAVSETAEKMRQRKVKSIVKKPYFIPDTQSLDVLFHAMQKKKIHMAVAVDEYGQTAGLVTMEDILEEIVGDIQDEYDSEEEGISNEGNGSFLVKGTTLLEDLEEALDIEIEEENFDTVNGLLVSELNHIPAEEERVTVFTHGLQMEILEVKNKMVTLARVTKVPEEKVPEKEMGEDR